MSGAIAALMSEKVLDVLDSPPPPPKPTPSLPQPQLLGKEEQEQKQQQQEADSGSSELSGTRALLADFMAGNAALAQVAFA
jgi:hypothetical protein